MKTKVACMCVALISGGYFLGVVMASNGRLLPWVPLAVMILAMAAGLLWRRK